MESFILYLLYVTYEILYLIDQVAPTVLYVLLGTTKTLSRRRNVNRAHKACTSHRQNRTSVCLVLLGNIKMEPEKHRV